MRRVSYKGILRQREVVAGLTLALLVVMLGVGIELYVSTQRTTLPATTRQLIEPLDPLIDLDTIEALEGKRAVSLQEAKTRVESAVNLGVAPATEEEGTPSAEAVQGTPPVSGVDTGPTAESQLPEPTPTPIVEEAPAVGDELLPEI